MKLRDDRRMTWPPVLATSKPYLYETTDERGQQYTIRDAYLLDGTAGRRLHARLIKESGTSTWAVTDLTADGRWPCSAPTEQKLAQSVVAVLRKLRGLKLVKAGEVEIRVP